jgi:hypothetical protein
MRRHASAGYGLAVRLILLAALLAALVVGPASGAQAERTGPTAAATLKRATCPGGLSGCRSAIGRVVLVESVDPDGDGDLHVVLVGRDSVTAPGFTAVDVRRGLRPRRDPKVGQLVTAAGQVQRGSYGQRQIHAVSFRVG